MVIILTEFLFYYMVALNIIAMILCLVDKNAARRNYWRVQERLFFIIAIMGGSLLMYITMLSIRHKTKHKRFMIGLPIIIIVQIAITILLFHFGILTFPRSSGFTI